MGRKQRLEPLFDGETILCPRCRTRTRILDIEILPELPTYQHETVPVFRCTCRHVFAYRVPLSVDRAIRHAAPRRSA